MTLAVGDKLGPYEILSPIGSGGMGEVWKARDARLNRIVAIKQLKGQHSARFEQEARAIAALNHPHICQIHDIGPDFLVLEYIEGLPLKGPLPVAEALRLASQIAEALEAAHSQGVVHRDLKPANIMVTSQGSAKLLDFGLAKQVTSSEETATLEGTLMGTPSYMAPEQAQGKPLDARSDVFSFGAVLYEILSGNRAFGGSSTAEVLSAVLRDEPPALKNHEAIEGIVRKCLAKQPYERFQSMSAVLGALRQVSLGPTSEEARDVQLPRGITRLIGRDRELEEVRDLLVREEIRLVNLTGPAGIGKTRLAIELCQRKEFGQVRFIQLQDVLDPLRVPSTILHGLGLREEDAQPPRSRLIKFLGEHKSALLVLDNFEQIADSAPLLQELLVSCPRLKILVTSRALLHLRAEHEYILRPLIRGNGSGLEDLLGEPAVALFLDRAPSIKPTLEVAQAIAEICARLDGLPLAIELAAARSKLLSPHALLERLRNRFQLLTGGARDLPDRQQTLRRAIDWSYDLLAPSEKLLLQTLSVFAGGASVESVESVCGGVEGDILDLLTSLVDQSLLPKDEEQYGNLRVRMLETIREYARERLESSGNASRDCARHASYYLTVAEKMNRRGIGGSQDEQYDLLEVEQSNCLAALDWFLKQGNAEAALRMAVALWPLWEARGYWTQGRAQLNRVLKETARVNLPLVRVKALYAVGVLADAQGDYSAARDAFEQHLALQRTSCTPAALAAAINNLGIVTLRQGDYELARKAYLEALEILRSLGSDLSVAQCLNNLGHVAMAMGDYGTAQQNYRESLAICRRLCSTQDIAWTLSNLGDVARELSQIAEAEVLYSQSLSLFREINNRVGLASCMADLGNLAVLREQYPLAAQLYQESLVIFGDLGDKRGITRVLEGFAAMASARGRPDVALRLSGAALGARNSLGLRQSLAERLRLDDRVSAARTALGSDAENLSAEGQRMPLERALAYALASAAL